MKKLLSLILVLAIGSVASAGSVWLEVDAADMKDSYNPSDIITINLMADTGVADFSVGAVGSDNGGTASGPLYIDPGFVILPLAGTLVNAGGVLVEFAGGSVNFLAPGVDAGLALWSFEFHVPELPDSSIIIIDDIINPEQQPNPYLTDIGFDDFSRTQEVAGLELHVTPEPMTIGLLGLGALSLLRRRRTA